MSSIESSGVASLLSFSKNRRDQGPNRILATKISDSRDVGILKELIDFFKTKPNKELQKDCVLTMAWVAETSPQMIVPYTDLLIENFNSSINRVVWGSMIALAEIRDQISEKLFEALPKILDAMDAGTVVTRDYGFRILISLYSVPSYQEDILYVILEQIRMAPDNQLGQYAEKFMVVLNPEHKALLYNVLAERLSELSNSHHIKRLNKYLLKLSRF